MGTPDSGDDLQNSNPPGVPAGPAFRLANQSSAIVSSAYGQSISQCFILDAQMQIDVAVAESPEEGGAPELFPTSRRRVQAKGNRAWHAGLLRHSPIQMDSPVCRRLSIPR